MSSLVYKIRLLMNSHLFMHFFFHTFSLIVRNDAATFLVAGPRIKITCLPTVMWSKG